MNWLNRLFSRNKQPYLETDSTTLKQFINSLRKSRYPKTQMDIVYEKQIVLQMFNQKDLDNWELKVPITSDEDGGVLIALSFNEEKIGNEQNFDRFFRTSFFKDFVSLTHDNTESYFLAYSNSMADSDIAEKVKNILRQVYLIEDKTPLEVFVRAF